MSKPTGRERLLAATRELLTERGFEATSPRDIQRRSGVGQGSFYHHFETKRDLARSALDEVQGEMLANLKNRLEIGSPLERIRAYLQAPREALAGCRLGRLAMERSVVEDDELRAPVAAYFEGLKALLRETIAEAIRAGELPAALRPDEIACTLAAIVQGGYVLARVSREPADLNHAILGALSLLEIAAEK